MPAPKPPATSLNPLPGLKGITSDETIQILAKAVEQSPVSVIITDPHGVIQYVNPKFTESMGFTPAEAIGKTQRIIKGGFLSRAFYKEMWAAILAGQEWHGVFQNRTKDGALVWEVASISSIRDDHGVVTHFVGVKEDITELKRLQAELDHMARHDVLTGLPNRALFRDRLEQALMQSKRRKTACALLYLDLDGFKPVNDTYGHETGDALLVAVARRLQECVRESDTVARMGGDEFTVVLTNLNDGQSVERISHALLASLSNPFVIDRTSVTIGASIGVSVYPGDGTTVNELLSAADGAMYRVKNQGKNRVGFSSQG